MDNNTLISQEIKRQINRLSVDDPLVSSLAELRKKNPSFTETDLLAALMSEQAVKIEPDPIIIEQERDEAFPVDALGDILGDVVNSCIAITQFPVALIAQSILAASTLAAQGVAVVQVADNDLLKNIPINNFFCSIGESGEGKGFMDELALAPHRAWNEQQLDVFKEVKAKYLEDLEIWKDDYKKGHASFKDKPKHPRQLGGILYISPTWEAIERGFINGKTSTGLFIEEGARFLSDFGMNKDNQDKTTGALCALWSSGGGSRERAQEEEYYKNRVFSIHIALQPHFAYKRMFNNEDMEKIGLFSRMLMIKPTSTIGERPWLEFLPHHLEAHKRYRQRMTELLNKTEECVDQETGELTKRRCLFLGRDAKRLFVDFHNYLQGEMGDAETKARLYKKIGKADPTTGVNGKYLSIRAFVNKGSLHAVKLAAVLQMVEDTDVINISAEYIERGIRLAKFYFDEALRIFSITAVSSEQAHAQVLLEWMRNNEHHSENGIFKIRELQRYAPSSRDRGKLLKSVNLLHDLSYGELFKVGRSYQFKLFPPQIEFDCHTPVTVLSHAKATSYEDCHTVTTVTGDKKEFSKGDNEIKKHTPDCVTMVTLCQSQQGVDYNPLIDGFDCDSGCDSCDNVPTIRQIILKRLNGEKIPLSDLERVVCREQGYTQEEFNDSLYVLREESQIIFDGEFVVGTK
jgi:hypothetical protein